MASDDPKEGGNKRKPRWLEAKEKARVKAERREALKAERIAENLDVLFGAHTVREALANPRRRFRRLLATENGVQRVLEGGEPPIRPEIVRPEAISRLLPADAVHQGLYLEAEKLEPLRLSALKENALVVALDQVTDPHNVGAILRTACAFGVDALLTTTRHAPELTGVLAKAASGAVEHVPIVVETNLGRALTTLADRGFRVVGLDSEADVPLSGLTLTRPLILVLGAEGKGLRPSTRALCTDHARIDLPGAIRSLNVSNAAAVALYAVGTALGAGVASSGKIGNS